MKPYAISEDGKLWVGVQDASDAEPSSSMPLPEQKSGSMLDSALIESLRALTEAIILQAEAIILQAEAISELAKSNEALADAAMSQPDEGEEQESGYLS